MQEDIRTIIENLSKRNMHGYYAPDRSTALTKALSLIKPQSTVGFGGSVTLEQIGILDHLRKDRKINLYDRTQLSKPSDHHRLYRQMFSSDVFLSSTNAITLKGQLVNVDGRGNRVAMMVYGPSSVIIIAGKNKITPDVDSAIDRIRRIACPLNLHRINALAKQSSAFSSPQWTLESIWGQVSIIERQLPTQKDRIHVIIVNEELGY